ncbi:MAG: mechanosensitive ion channel [Clostridia bacterium]|nr:mechanosensitive ion channel [Clostridia bacterium]
MPEFLQKILDTIAEFVTTFGFKLLGSIIVLIIGIFLIKWVTKLMAGAGGFKKLPKNAQTLIINLITGLLYVVLAVTIALIFDVPAASLVAVLGSAGLAIGLALQGGLSNIAGGIIILCAKPFEVGDFIDNGTHMGTVIDIGLFYTKIQTPDNKLVTVPNATISNQSVTDYSAYETRRLDIPITITRDADVEYVKETLVAVANAHELVLKDPAPVALITSHSESGPVYNLRVWVKNEDYWTVNFDLHEFTKKVMDSRGIEMACHPTDVYQK